MHKTMYVLAVKLYSFLHFFPLELHYYFFLTDGTDCFDHSLTNW